MSSNRGINPTMEMILDLLEEGPKERDEISVGVDRTERAIRDALSVLKKKGMIEHIRNFPQDARKIIYSLPRD